MSSQDSQQSEVSQHGSPSVIYQPPSQPTSQNWSPFKFVEEVPCARSSLLSGIASGVGIGFVRGLSAGAFVASNWAVGTFVFVSLGTWHVCRRALDVEHAKMQTIVEKMPQRLVKKAAGSSDSQR